MQRSLQPASRVALVLSPALGDSLLMMIVARNLHANGVAVTVFGRQANELAAWFPDVDIRPDLSHATVQATLAGFDTVIQMHLDRPFAHLERLHPRVVLLDSTYRARSSKSMAERLAQFCRDELGLASVGKSNGIIAPAALQHRRHLSRVAIHPTASTLDKCWLPSRFIRLALRLRKLGFSPQFVVAREERQAWAYVERYGIALPELDTLDSVAAWLYESGWFIGNDSGIGHLASNLQVPTLSLFMRRGLARTWHPGWGAGSVVVGSAYLPTGRMRERYWKYTLSVARVARAFEQLRETLA
ncbi:ADP-heptose--LPS heptosyltransferase [Burkholderia sp. WAC0059]|uniref:glycosyltransferase family 9 protein n=1 Tax=Burkholderia sp. WAC0059 TaxID=2066022 RepID=UPI000C7ED6E0|nr:glycosyltransferase family 9 protein [Burkholderia sp. WAC0059]PLZ03086.1 ADP-heptose--LPS heptosyltransferase [Burkholderia sp. WAC0059]